MHSFLWALLILVPWGVKAVELGPYQSEYSLSHAFEYWVAPNKAIDPRQLNRKDQDALFKAPSQNSYELNLGFVENPVWIRLTLNRHSSASSNWILEIPYLGLDQVNLYMPSGVIQHNGSSIAIDKKPYFSRFYAFPLELTPIPETYFFRIESTYPITLPLRIIERDAFNQTQFSENLVQAIYYGSLLSLLIYNLLQFATLRDKKYLLYSVFALFTGLGIFAGNGYARIYLWPDSPDWDEVAQSCLLSTAAGLGLIFTRLFLSSYKYMPVTNRAMELLAATYFLLAVVLIASIYLDIPTQFIYFAIYALTLIAPCIALYSSTRNALAGFHSANYFALGWFALLMGALIASLRIFNVVPSNVWTLYALQISSGVEMLLFSVALAYRFKSEQKLIEKVQKELLEAREQTLQAMKLTGDRLERAVEARTQKLQELLISEQHMREQYVRFGAMISHEFRNPLNIIQAQTTMLEIASKLEHEQVIKRTSVIHSAIQRLVKLFDQWLESDRLSQPHNQIKKELLTMPHWLIALVNTCHVYHPEHILTVDKPTRESTILADDHLLQIAVLNLIDNACKYSPAGTEIHIGLLYDDYAVGIYVADQGCGIPDDIKDKVLDPYVRSNSNDQIKGMGLGLAFVKKIMDAHEGRIEIKSPANQGTTIILWMPEPIA